MSKNPLTVVDFVVGLVGVEAVGLNEVVFDAVTTDAGTIGLLVTGTTPVDLIT